MIWKDACFFLYSSHPVIYLNGKHFSVKKREEEIGKAC
jgi:hypothetical protein